MKRAIVRNIAIVSAIFIVAFSAMLIVNYFQVRGATPLQTEVIETLKELNDRNAGNPALQQQIRELDLLARRAYFTRMDHLMTGVYILLGMLAVFVVCARLYFARDKDIPDKEIDPIDEWMIKTKARKYVVWATSGLAVVALVFVVMTSPHLRSTKAGGNAERQVASQVQDVGAVGISSATSGGNTGQPETTPEDPAAGGELSGALADGERSGVAANEERSRVSTNEEQSGATSNEGSGRMTSDVASGQTGTSESVAWTDGVTHNAFRGNNSNGISPARNLPVKWDLSSGANIAWKQDIPRGGYNSPVINGNRVFFSGADQQARELYCYDLTTGERLWSLAAANIPGSPSQMPETTEDTGLAASSVATNGAQVCAIFATGDIICADMDGNRLWAKNIGVPDNHYGYASSLLIYGNSVIVQYDNNNSPRVMALNLATGDEKWSRSRSERVTWSSPIITTAGGSPQLVLMGNPAITAYNPDSGEELWRVVCMSGEVGASACSLEGVIFGASEYAKLVAIDGADGTLLWESMEFLPEVSSPVATGNTLYIATSYGVFAAYDTKSGELKKEHELGVEFYSSPIIADGRIYLLSNDGKMHIFSADSDFNLLDSFETGERTFATPAFTDGKIVVRTENSIYCVSAK